MNIKIEGIEKLTNSLKPSIFSKAINATINEVVGGSLSKSRTQIKKKWNIDLKNDGGTWKFQNKTTGETKKRSGIIKIIKATNSRGYVEIVVTGEPINLSLFSFSYNEELRNKKTFKQKRAVAKKAQKDVNRGKVRVKILKTKTTTLPKSFWATMKSGHKGIFTRIPSSKKIVENRSITPTSMFKQIDFESILTKDISEKLAGRFSHNLSRITNGYWK
jgi:hypothetical protein